MYTKSQPYATAFHSLDQRQIPFLEEEPFVMTSLFVYVTTNNQTMGTSQPKLVLQSRWKQ